jgi:ABC-type transport system substrate-binding protein
LKYVKNPDYWVKGKPYMDGIESIYVADPTTQRLFAESGQGDILDILNLGKEAADFAKMGFTVKTDMNANGVLVPDSAHADSIWSNKQVREAVEYAIDREAIAKGLGYGYLQAPNQIPPRDSLAYDPDFPLARSYNPEKAKQLLAEAGYPNGFKTTIIAAPMFSRDLAVAVQADLAKVGIQVELDFPDIGKYMTYVGPAAYWHNAMIFMPLPSHEPTFIEALRFMDFLWGPNWLKTPEIIQAYQSALSAPVPDPKLARAVTDLITKEALVIPACEIGMGRGDRPYVFADFSHKYEDWWMNK